MENKIYHPTFNESPALKWFPHWMSEDGLVDGIDVEIYFTSEFIGGSERIKNVSVMYLPKTKMKEMKLEDHPVWQKTNWYLRHFGNSTGNCCRDWMEKPDNKKLYQSTEPAQFDKNPTELFEWFLDA